MPQSSFPFFSLSSLAQVKCTQATQVNQSNLSNPFHTTLSHSHTGKNKREGKFTNLLEFIEKKSTCTVNWER